MANTTQLASDYPVKYITVQPLNSEGGYKEEDINERKSYPIGAEAKYVELKDKLGKGPSTEKDEKISLQTWIDDAENRLEVEAFVKPNGGVKGTKIVTLQEWLNNARKYIEVNGFTTPSISLETLLEQPYQELKVLSYIYNKETGEFTEEKTSLQNWLNNAEERIQVTDKVNTNLNSEVRVPLAVWIDDANNKIEVKGLFTRNSNSETWNSLQTWIDTIEEKVGNDNLNTSAQKITAAINELKNNIGNISNLTTTQKTNLVAAISETEASIKALDTKVGTTVSLSSIDGEKSNLTKSINKIIGIIGDTNLGEGAQTLRGAIVELKGKLKNASNTSKGIVQGDGDADTSWKKDGTWVPCKVDNGYVYFQPGTEELANTLAQIYQTNSISLGRLEGSTVGTNSIAFGVGVVASGKYSQATGSSTQASGNYSHAEGERSIASGIKSHAEGENTQASGDCSHAEGYFTKAIGKGAHAEGSGFYNDYGYADFNTANGNGAHAEGHLCTANGQGSHAEGYKATAAEYSFAHGTKLTGHANSSTPVILDNVLNIPQQCFGFGNNMKINKTGLCAFGYNLETISRPEDPGIDLREQYEPIVSMAVGSGYYIPWNALFSLGDQENTEDTILASYPSYWIDTNGTSHSGSADYAEKFYPWWDDNNLEDRFGYFVTVKNQKLYKANENDYIIGITSKKPILIGNDTVENCTPVGMLGQLIVYDDGTCKVNEFCKCGENGIATYASEYGLQTYYVIERVSENEIKVILK